MAMTQRVIRRKRVRLISIHRIDKNLTDIVYEAKARVRERPRQNDEVPDLIESKIVPGLFFNLFQGSILYSNPTPENPPDLVFRFLLYLERCAANGAREDVLRSCWTEGGTDAALRNAILKTNEFLVSIGVAKTVNRSGNDIIWE